MVMIDSPADIFGFRKKETIRGKFMDQPSTFEPLIKGRPIVKGHNELYICQILKLCDRRETF